jgi:hypothetical protein
MQLTGIRKILEALPALSTLQAQQHFTGQRSIAYWLSTLTARHPFRAARTKPRTRRRCGPDPHRSGGLEAPQPTLQQIGVRCFEAAAPLGLNAVLNLRAMLAKSWPLETVLTVVQAQGVVSGSEGETADLEHGYMVSGGVTCRCLPEVATAFWADISQHAHVPQGDAAARGPPGLICFLKRRRQVLDGPWLVRVRHPPIGLIVPRCGIACCPPSPPLSFRRAHGVRGVSSPGACAVDRRPDWWSCLIVLTLCAGPACG